MVLDAWSLRIVSWAMAPRMPAELVGVALTMAIACRHPEGPVIHHSDQDSQYTSLVVRPAVPGGRCRAVDVIEGFYNSSRLHYALSYQSPANCE